MTFSTHAYINTHTNTHTHTHTHTHTYTHAQTLTHTHNDKMANKGYLFIFYSCSVCSNFFVVYSSATWLQFTKLHCVKNVRILNFFCFVFFRIWTNYRDLPWKEKKKKTRRKLYIRTLFKQ